jgi:hypothetical protein
MPTRAFRETVRNALTVSSMILAVGTARGRRLAPAIVLAGESLGWQTPDATGECARRAPNSRPIDGHARGTDGQVAFTGTWLRFAFTSRLREPECPPTEIAALSCSASPGQCRGDSAEVVVVGPPRIRRAVLAPSSGTGVA